MNIINTRALAACALVLTGQAAAHAEPSPTPSERAAALAVIKAGFADASPEWTARLKQDEAQAVCSQYRNDPPAKIRQKLEKAQLATLVYPASGKLTGDWRVGEKIAQEGRGLQFSDAPGGPVGGNCYACHQMAPKEIAFGTLGPSLYQYGKLRGNSEAVARYTYGKIYNSQAYAACSNMPRFGHQNILSEQQIRDVVAFLLDPESPVNQ